jgi:hypothetical protein
MKSSGNSSHRQSRGIYAVPSVLSLTANSFAKRVFGRLIPIATPHGNSNPAFAMLRRSVAAIDRLDFARRLDELLLQSG